VALSQRIEAQLWHPPFTRARAVLRAAMGALRLCYAVIRDESLATLLESSTAVTDQAGPA
jgi:hypothetical protein